MSQPYNMQVQKRRHSGINKLENTIQLHATLKEISDQQLRVFLLDTRVNVPMDFYHPTTKFHENLQLVQGTILFKKIAKFNFILLL